MAGEAGVVLEYCELPLLRLVPSAMLPDILVIRRYQEGEYLFSQDDTTTGLWIVLEGRVSVERIAPDGTVATTGVWVTGEIVGIAGLWDQSGYPASARALSHPTVMGWLARDVVMRLHQEIPAFGLEISRLLSERLRFVQESRSSRQGRPIVNQVASVLLTLLPRMGSSIGLTHEDLAHIIGTHRETVTRAIQELVRAGAVASRHGTIEIADPKKLQEWSVGRAR
jgi:CRP-like cAMP-binding protein